MPRGGSRPGAGRKRKIEPPVSKVGAPTLYKAEYAEQARKLCELGATDADLASFFSVHIASIHRWSAKYPEFCEARKIGKDACDERVERSLYHRAVGYTFESEKVFQFQGAIVRAPTKEHVPPDTTAAIFWLKNRRPDAWRDRREHELTGKDGGPIQTESTVIVLPANGREVS